MNAQFFQQMGSPGIFVDDPEYKPDIYTYTFVVIRMEIKGSCHGFPVSVVCQTDKFSPGVHYRTAGITSGDVQITEKSCV